jgi:hypothetical protein
MTFSRTDEIISGLLHAALAIPFALLLVGMTARIATHLI